MKRITAHSLSACVLPVLLEHIAVHGCRYQDGQINHDEEDLLPGKIENTEDAGKNGQAARKQKAIAGTADENGIVQVLRKVEKINSTIFNNLANQKTHG